MVDEERIKISRDLELLQKICDDINNGEEVEITLNKYKAPPKIAKAGKTADGKQYFSLIYDGKRIKRSADKEYLQKVMDDINEGVEVEAALKRNMKTSEIKPPKIGKDGKTTEGEQRYVLKYRNKKLKRSVDKVHLQNLIDTKEYLRIYEEKFLKK